jgi:hypothetical protein
MHGIRLEICSHRRASRRQIVNQRRTWFLHRQNQCQGGRAGVRQRLSIIQVMSCIEEKK